MKCFMLGFWFDNTVFQCEWEFDNFFEIVVGFLSYILVLTRIILQDR